MGFLGNGEFHYMVGEMFPGPRGFQAVDFDVDDSTWEGGGAGEVYVMVIEDRDRRVEGDWLHCLSLVDQALGSWAGRRSEDVGIVEM